MNDLLLVIDMQNVYLPDQPWACETVAHTKANILKLLEKYPKNQTIFTRYIAAKHPVGGDGMGKYHRGGIMLYSISISSFQTGPCHLLCRPLSVCWEQLSV